MNAHQLKNSILQEAIEGRLVPQDSNDEPASVLLEKIRKEKARLVKEGKLKKKDLVEIPISEEEIPFKIPESWVWVRINDIAISQLGKTLDRGKQSGNEYPYLCSINVYWNCIDLSKVKSFLLKDEELEKYKLKKGDLLVCEGGDYGRCNVWVGEDEMYYQNALHRIRFFCGLSPFFYKYVFEIYRYTDYIVGQGQTIKHFTYDSMKSILFPLPPLKEQKRIVAKIEELMPKVEEYGKAQETLDKLNEELPERLKKSILQEAIEGRLVPQDPNDEPASVLLEKIRKEKAKRVKEGKLKKKDLIETSISEDEIPFKIPDSWEWSKLGEHISATSGLAYKKDDLSIYSNEYVRVLRGGNISFGSWCVKDDDIMIGKQFVNEDMILKKGMFISPAVTSLEHMGKTALIREDQNNVVAGGFVLMLITHYCNEIYWEYLNILFQTGYYSEKCKSITNKSGQAFFNLSRAKLLEMPIPLPPLGEQKRIVEKVEQLFREIEKLKV